MKRATKLKKIAEKFVTDILSHTITKADATKQLFDLLRDAYDLTTDDYPASTLCDHGVRFDKECDECNKL